MIIDLRNDHHNCGVYGLVVFIEDKSKAVKIFKKKECKNHVLNVYNSEVGAYKKTQNCEKAKLLVPVFYNSVCVTQVIDSTGEDITERFYTDLVYVMSFEEGCFQKFGLISKIENERVTSIFNNVGIYYLTDASVTLDDLGKVKKVIDFAIKEFEVWA